jgi:hypothetical protein
MHISIAIKGNALLLFARASSSSGRYLPSSNRVAGDVPVLLHHKNPSTLPGSEYVLQKRTIAFSEVKEKINEYTLNSVFSSTTQGLN